MERQFITTEDGSHTLFVPELKEHYHSVYGAIQESLHVYIKSCYQHCLKDPISILEVGMGTALNAFLTYEESLKDENTIFYTAIEKYPIPAEIYSKLNYPELINTNSRNVFQQIHEAEWNKKTIINYDFSILKIEADITTVFLDSKYDIVYYDAFAPDKQHELWNSKIFKKIYEQMNKDGILITYSAKGIVKAALREAGFIVKRLKGPFGKRHIVRAVKN